MRQISDETSSPRIEVVRSDLDDRSGEELLRFWEHRRALTREEGHRRLPEVVCVLRHDGEIAGASSVFPTDMGLIGGRRFWIYRSLLDDHVSEHSPMMIRATFDALDRESQDGPGAPIGLCVLVGADQRRQRPEAEWRDPRMAYAGYLDDVRQVRIAYFANQVSGMASDETEHGWRPAPGYRVELFAEQDAVTAEDVIDLWTREAGLPVDEAERRAGELLLVAIGPGGQPVGMSTTYVQRNEQLRDYLWYYRTFVSAAARKSNIGVSLAVGGREHIVQRFTSGGDRRGIGILYEIENEGLKRYFPKGHWMPIDALLIGENARGDHVRVHYFPGAPAPEP